MRKINKAVIREEYQIIDKDEFWEAWKHFGNNEEDFKIESYWSKGNFFNAYYVSWNLILKLVLNKDSKHFTKLKIEIDKQLKESEEKPKRKRGRPRKDKNNEEKD